MTEKTSDGNSGSVAHTPDELAGQLEDADQGDVLTYDERVAEIRTARRDAAALAEKETRKRNVPLGGSPRTDPIEGGLSEQLAQTPASPSFESKQERQLRELQEDVARLEAKFDALLAALDVTLPEQEREQE